VQRRRRDDENCELQLPGSNKDKLVSDKPRTGRWIDFQKIVQIFFLVSGLFNRDSWDSLSSIDGLQITHNYNQKDSKGSGNAES